LQTKLKTKEGQNIALDVLLEVFANSPPAILIALGFVLLFFGYSANTVNMINAGWIFVGLGVILQVAWLIIMANR
jgi:hypothetical protein